MGKSSKSIKALFGLSVLMASGAAVARDLPTPVGSQSDLIANLDGKQKMQLFEMLKDMNVEVKNWDDAGVVEQPSKCFRQL